MNSLAGYDPAVKGWREVAFQADGGNATIVYRQSLDELRGNPVGKVVRGTLKEITKDGKQGSAEINLTLTARDRWEGRIVDRSRDGETLPDIRAVFERKKN